MHQLKLGDFRSTEEERQDAHTSDDGIQRQERIAAHAFRVGQADVVQLDIDMREERDRGSPAKLTARPVNRPISSAMRRLARSVETRKGIAATATAISPIRHRASTMTRFMPAGVPPAALRSPPTIAPPFG